MAGVIADGGEKRTDRSQLARLLEIDFHAELFGEKRYELQGPHRIETEILAQVVFCADVRCRRLRQTRNQRENALVDRKGCHAEIMPTGRISASHQF
jgi:hypothetical protein